LWGQIGGELSSNIFLLSIWSYYHSIITKVLIINKQRKMHSVAVLEYGWSQE
jgi:hypothetical protein